MLAAALLPVDFFYCLLTLNENCASAVIMNRFEAVHTTFSSVYLTTGRCFFSVNFSDLTRSLSFKILFTVDSLGLY